MSDSPAAVLYGSDAIEKGTPTNPVRTDPTGDTAQPISADSLPLPTGAATETTLAGVKAGTDRIPASPAQEHVAADSPHATRLTDGTDFYKATTPADTQPISAVTLPLPTGATTEATLVGVLEELSQKTEPGDTQVVSLANFRDITTVLREMLYELRASRRLLEILTDEKVTGKEEEP